MIMERSLLPLPQKKKSTVSGKNSSTVVVASTDKSKSVKSNSKSSDTPKKKISSLDLNKSAQSGTIREGKNKLRESDPGMHVNSKQRSVVSQMHDAAYYKRISNLNNLEATPREHYEPPRIYIRDGTDLSSTHGFVLSRGQCGALSCSNKSRFQESKPSSLRSFSKHLPQFAKDVLNSKGCTSKVQPTYQKLDKMRFGDDLVEELDVVDESEGSPIYHELDPIGIQCSKHTYQSIGEIQEELSKMGSMPNIPEPRSAPPLNISLVPQNSSNLVTPVKVKSSPKSFFSKMWQPRKNQKSSQKECKFINSMPLLLPKDSPDYTPDEAQQSPSLITFHGASRSQMGSISQPGSANLERSGYASSPRTCRVFTFEDIEINDTLFPQPHEVIKLEKKASPLPFSKDFKLKLGPPKHGMSPLTLDSPKSETSFNIGCYATLMFPENSFLNNVPSLPRKNIKLIKCFEPHSKALHSAIVPPRLLSNNAKMIAFGRSSLVKEPHCQGDLKLVSRSQNTSKTNFYSDDFTNDFSELKNSPNTSGSIESLLSQDTLRSDSPVFHQSHSPLHRSPYSSPSCGVRMAEIRANSRRSDSKSPSPEPPLCNTAGFPYFHKDIHYPRLDGTIQSTHLIKSPPRVVCKSPNRYMHTILEEEHSVEHVVSIQSLEEASTSASSSDLPAVILEKRAGSNSEESQICEDRLKTSLPNINMNGSKLSSLSPDDASVSSDFFLLEDYSDCHTTKSDECAVESENEPSLLRRDQYYIKLPSEKDQNNSSNQACSLDKMSKHPITQSSEKCDEGHVGAGDRLVRSSKLRPPKSSFYVTAQDSAVDKVSSTFHSGSSKSPPHDSNQSNGCASLPFKTQQLGGAEGGRKPSLFGSMVTSKQSPLKGTKLISSFGQSPSSPSNAVKRQQSDLVAIEIKTPSNHGQNQGNRVLRPPKNSKSQFGYAKHQKYKNDSSLNSSAPRNCQTIPVPTRGTASGFDSFPKSETSIIHHGSRQRPTTSTAVCDLNSSLSSSPTSSSSSMFSTVESENESLLLTFRKDLMPGDGRFKASKEASNQSLDSRATSSLNSNSESENSRGSDRSRLQAPRTDVSRCLEMYTKILGTSQDSSLRTNSSKQLKTPTVPTDC